MDNYKKCNKCKKVKPQSDFKIGGFICKECSNEKNIKTK